MEIYVVLAVSVVIWLGIFGYLASTDRRLSQAEQRFLRSPDAVGRADDQG